MQKPLIIIISLSAFAFFQPAFPSEETNNIRSDTGEVDLLCKKKSDGTMETYRLGKVVRTINVEAPKQISLKLTDDSCLDSRTRFQFDLKLKWNKATCLLDTTGKVPPTYEWGKDLMKIELNRLDGTMVRQIILGSESGSVTNGLITTELYQCEVKKPLF